MKTKTLKLAMALLAGLFVSMPTFAAGVPGGEGDTVIIESNGTKIIIQTDSSSGLNGLSSVDINRMVQEITRSMTAASEEMAREMKAIEEARKAGEISDDEAEERRERAEEELERQVEAMEEELEAQMEALELLNEEMGRRVIIKAMGDDEEDFDYEFNRESDDDEWDEDEWDEDWNWDWDDEGDPTIGYFDLSIGLNNYLDADGQFPAAGTDDYALRTWSMHWGLGFGAKTRLGNENSPAHIKYGIEMAWSNYNYEGTHIPVKTEDETIFPDNLQSSYDKNKMNVTTLNIPLMLQLDFSDNRATENGFNMGIGGYAGLRIGSSGKFKYRDGNNEKVNKKVKSDFFLTDFQYGLQAQIGVAGVNFFARYALNTLFQENRGPELTPVVFGIVL